MSRSQPYPAPPIIDSVVELRLKKPFTEAELSRIVKAFKGKYERYEETGEVEVQVRLESGTVTPSVSNPRPMHIFSDTDQTEFCRIELLKLHWSKLPPYPGWEVLERRIDRDLGVLPKKMGLPDLERIGVRFQNRLDVPFGPDHVSRYEDYLSVHIALPPLLDPHGTYMWRVQKTFEDRNLGATVSSAIVRPEIPGTAAILLDIDVFAVDHLPVDKNGLFRKLSELRALKNEIFETCVTDKARASFQ